MIFNISNGPFSKTPVLDAAYPQDVSVNVGDSATFRVIVAQDGKPPEYTYQWYYDGAAVDGSTQDTYTREAELGSHSVFCNVTNKAGTVVSRTAALNAERLYLYKEGDECTAVTGGWNGTKGTDYLSFGGKSSSDGGVTKIFTNETFSCVGYTQMVVDHALTNKHGSGNGNFVFKLSGSSASVTTATKNVTTNERRTVTVDVSGVTGEVQFTTSAYYATVRVYNVYLLK